MDERRSQRVSEAVREELSEIIGFESADPRLAIVHVTGVHVSPDMRHARVSVGLQGDDREQRQALQALQHAGQYLRRELARRLNLRRAPELHFENDPWQEAPARVEILLKRAKKMRGPSENQH